jgi:hypothetical protein
LGQNRVTVSPRAHSANSVAAERCWATRRSARNPRTAPFSAPDRIHPQMIRPCGGFGSKPTAILTSCGKLSKELHRGSCCHFQGQTCDCQEQKRCCQTKQSPVDGMVTIVNLSPCELLRMGGVSEDDTATISGSRVDGDPSVTPFPSWARPGRGPGPALSASRRFRLGHQGAGLTTLKRDP